MPIPAEPHKVIDCHQCYHPNRMERALSENHLIRIRGKKEFKVQPPRLKHRRDGRKYISKEIDSTGKYKAWSSGILNTGYITSPLYVNPNRGENALSKTTIDILLNQIPAEQLEGIVGTFNTEKVVEYTQGSTEIHKFYEEEDCVWRPNQLLTWGRIVDNEFVALNAGEVLCGIPVNARQFSHLMEAALPPEQWQSFVGKKSKKVFGDLSSDEILGLRLFSSIATLQRTEMDNNNCFGLCLHQFGMCIETRYLHNLDELYAYIVINRRDPVKEKKSQAKLRLSGIGELESVTEVVEEAVEETFAYEEDE